MYDPFSHLSPALGEVREDPDHLALITVKCIPQKFPSTFVPVFCIGRREVVLRIFVAFMCFLNSLRVTGMKEALTSFITYSFQLY